MGICPLSTMENPWQCYCFCHHPKPSLPNQRWIREKMKERKKERPLGTRVDWTECIFVCSINRTTESLLEATFVRIKSPLDPSPSVYFILFWWLISKKSNDAGREGNRESLCSKFLVACQRLFQKTGHQNIQRSNHSFYSNRRGSSGWVFRWGGGGNKFSQSVTRSLGRIHLLLRPAVFRFRPIGRRHLVYLFLNDKIYSDQN